MKAMTKMISSAAVAVLAASPALAQPTLNAVYEGETAGGNNAFLFEIISDDLTGSYAVELGFEANINQSLAFGGGLDTDSLSQAQQAAGIGGSGFEIE